MIVSIEGKQGTGMTLTGVYLTYKLYEYFGKTVVTDYAIKRDPPVELTLEGFLRGG